MATPALTSEYYCAVRMRPDGTEYLDDHIIAHTLFGVERELSERYDPDYRDLHPVVRIVRVDAIERDTAKIIDGKFL